MTKIDEATAPFVEAEIKGHQAALIRQMVAAGIIICVVRVGENCVVNHRHCKERGWIAQYCF
jgi:hypothetical protein